jgi:hypothetical protein
MMSDMRRTNNPTTREYFPDTMAAVGMYIRETDVECRRCC